MSLMFTVRCFSCSMVRKLFSHLSFKASIVTCGIFALWFSLNQMFVIKFSVSFDTERVERTTPSHVTDNRDLRWTKNLKRATGHLSSPAENIRGLKSLLF